VEIISRFYEQMDYAASWQAMASFTDTRHSQTPDELWFLQHPPVYTLGKNGDPANVLDAGDIPVIATDRGGQVTYHGPGQLVVYTMLDLKRLQLGVRDMVTLLENSVIALLSDYGIAASSCADAPGVYVNHAKIAALGLRVRKGCCFHGLAFNVAMNLEPFQRINPCGYQHLAITQLSDFIKNSNFNQVRQDLQQHLLTLINGHRK